MCNLSIFKVLTTLLWRKQNASMQIKQSKCLMKCCSTWHHVCRLCRFILWSLLLATLIPWACAADGCHMGHDWVKMRHRSLRLYVTQGEGQKMYHPFHRLAANCVIHPKGFCWLLHRDVNNKSHSKKSSSVCLSFRWLFHKTTCVVYAFCGVLFGLCSLTNLTVLSSVCWLKVCCPNYGESTSLCALINHFM